MNNLIPTEGETDTQAEASIAGLRLAAAKKARELLAAGAPEFEVAEYLANLEPAAEDNIPPPEGAL